MSPAAVTIGAVTLSRSQLRRTPSCATHHGDPQHHDRRQEAADHRDHDEVGDRDGVLEPEADRDGLGQDREHERHRQRHRDRRREVLADDACRAGADIRNVPVWIAVPRRLPSAPNTLPRMPMAAGTRTSRPGRASRVPVIAPRVSPASRSPPELSRSAYEARSDPDGVRAQQRAEAREDGSPRLQHGYSEARSFPRLLHRPIGPTEKVTRLSRC